MAYYTVDVGDVLLVAYKGGHDYAKKVKVIRITPQQIITDDIKLKYWRKNGKEVASFEGHIMKVNGIKKHAKNLETWKTN